MTPEQRTARNEAYQLIAIAERMMRETGLVAYADEAAVLCAVMKQDNKVLRDQEMQRRINA